MKSSPTEGPRRNWALVWMLGLALLVGATSTGFWLGRIELPAFAAELFTPRVAVILVTCVVITCVNLMLRWFRWHFLIRRFTPELATRDSLVVYLATLWAIVSPFFLAELIRVPLIRKRFHTPASFLVRVWITERFLDVAVLASALLFAVDRVWGLLGSLALLGVVALLFRVLLGSQPAATRAWVAGAAVAISFVAWSLAVVAMLATLRLLSQPIGLGTALRSFAGGTLLGGISGLPLSVSVAGSRMIGELVAAGVPTETSMLAILLYRAGTAWFAVLLGFVCLGVFRDRLRRLATGTVDAHFDEIASEYEGEIPAHVRERLLGHKVLVMHETLVALGFPKGARGLDLGCGHGWYMREMNLHGYAVDGMDSSSRQLTLAASHLADGLAHRAALVRGDGQRLPFADGSYDFAYAINALHHVLPRAAQADVFSEVVRVLKPGGVLLLHEMNTYNPLFRWYMGYVFPLLKKIDEGTEQWILPTALPATRGAHWLNDATRYFTFLPDFIPGLLLTWLGGLERFLETSRLRILSAHYQACLMKDRHAPPAATPSDTPPPPSAPRA